MNHPELVHRGISVRLHPEDHALVHDQGRPADERAHHLLNAVTREGHEPLGQHWSTDRSWAEHFARNTGGHAEGATEVIFHATHPEHHEIEHDEGWRAAHEVNDSEDEVPIRHGVDMEVRAVSWRPHVPPGTGQYPWHHHVLHEEQYHQAGRSRLGFKRAAGAAGQKPKNQLEVHGAAMHETQSPGHESLHKILHTFRFADGESWEGVKANYDMSHPVHQQMRESIRQHGIQEPIAIDYEQSPPEVVDGHTRLMHAEALGHHTVPVKHTTFADHHYYGSRLGFRRAGGYLEPLNAAQEHMRRHFPVWGQHLGSEEDATATFQHLLRRGGHPDAENAEAFAHPVPGWHQSQLGRGDVGQLTAAIHPHRWDYGTLAHETAHALHQHASGRATSREHAHDESFMEHYRTVGNMITPGAGDELHRVHEEHRHGRTAGKGKPRHRAPDVAHGTDQARGDASQALAPDSGGNDDGGSARAQLGPLAEHPKVASDLKKLPKQIQAAYHERVDGLRRGETHSSTHPLRGPLKGWSSTSLNFQYRLVHRHVGGELHVLSAGNHDESYETSQRRAALEHGVDDVTQTPWHRPYGPTGFRDQPVVSLPIASLHRTQGAEDTDRPSPDSDEPVNVVHHQGTHWLYDGHHRVMRAADRGQSHIDARVIHLGARFIESSRFAHDLDRCQTCFGRAEDDEGHECGGCDGSGRRTCPCGRQVAYDPADGFQHLDGSISHDGGLAYYSVSDLMDMGRLPKRLDGSTRTARYTAPKQRIFGPTYGLDTRLFDGEHLKNPVRVDVVGRFAEFCAEHVFEGHEQWAKIVFFGSEASEWTNPHRHGNGDFDLSIGIEYDLFRAHNPSYARMPDEGIADMFTRSMHAELNDPHHTFPGVEGTYDLTWFANLKGWNIAEIKPYSAYDVVTGEWIVRPPHLPDWDISKFPQGPGLAAAVRGIVEMAEGILTMPEPFRTQEASQLWEFIHSSRSRAFGPQGEGWWGTENVLEKALDQKGLMQRLWSLMDAAKKDPSRLDAPADWSNTPASP